MTEAWKAFWDNYRNQEARTDDDLFIQVGRTVQGRPISHEEFSLGVRHVVEMLALEQTDVVFEYCCGNGLVSRELARHAGFVIASDFADHLVAAARQWSRRPNVTYHLWNALEPLDDIIDERRPNKFLMAYALAHFTPDDLERIVRNAIAVRRDGPFTFLLTGIPDDSRMFSFYDTAERRLRFAENQAKGSVTNDGMGRWWKAAEIVALAERLGLHADVRPEPAGLTHYRMDALLRRA
jgi:SAM-dependent methyltransferase